MNKQDFLDKLREGLAGLPKEDIEERVSFYEEMMDDRMEDDLSEEEAVSEMGNMDEIIAQIIADTPLTKLVKEKIKPGRKLKTWEIVLLILGSPLWLSLLAAVFAVYVALYVSAWAVIISLWAVFISLAACGIAGVVMGTVTAAKGGLLKGVALMGAGFVCAGLSIIMFYLCKGATGGILSLTKKKALWMKNRFIGKENVK